MTEDFASVLDTLPVELLHRILDCLDAETILISFQYVCKRLNLIIHNYNRHKFNFKSIFKHRFHQLCRNTDPKNVISLILSNENQTSGQIGLFLSLYHIEEYTRLQIVQLLSIEDSHLKIILEHLVTIHSLKSLMICCSSNFYPTKDIIRLVSLILKKTTLQKLDLNLGYGATERLEWPIKSSIQYLKLFDSILLDTFCKILQSSPYLNTMILQDCLILRIDQFNAINSSTIVYDQLTSLTFEDCDLDILSLESLLSLIPSLVHFTIKSDRNDCIDGTRWEHFIEKNLPKLIKFQFTFQFRFDFNDQTTTLESFITSFQTPFWLETKRWFVTALTTQNSHILNLYTTNDCAKKINYRSKSNKTLCSTIPTTMKDLLTMDSVRELTLNLVEMQTDIAQQIETSIYRLFNNLTKLILRLNTDWSENSLRLLSSLIDLSTITDLELDITFTSIDVSNTIHGIINLLEKTTNIQSLIISNQTISLETICSIISHRIQHLQIHINSIEDIKTILQQFNHLSSVTFEFLVNSQVHTTDIIKWLITNGKDFTYQSTKYSLSLWLNKKT